MEGADKTKACIDFYKEYMDGNNGFIKDIIIENKIYYLEC